MSRYRKEPMYNRWTEGAIKCSKCEVVPKWFKKSCRMKKSVIMLVRDLGKPFERKNVLTNNIE